MLSFLDSEDENGYRILPLEYRPGMWYTRRRGVTAGCTFMLLHDVQQFAGFERLRFKCIAWEQLDGWTCITLHVRPHIVHINKARGRFFEATPDECEELNRQYAAKCER
jgi:hypothetical protein